MSFNLRFWTCVLLIILIAPYAAPLAILPGGFALWYLFRGNTVSAQTGKQEVIINKEDTDYIFTLKRAQWEEYAKRMVHPNGWEIRLSPHDTGTGVMSYDAKNGVGLSIQPLYKDNISLPDILIVGSYFPIGTLGNFTDKRKKSMEAAAIKDLGSGYSASLTYKKITASMEAVEIMVTKAKP